MRTAVWFVAACFAARWIAVAFWGMSEVEAGAHLRSMFIGGVMFWLLLPTNKTIDTPAKSAQ